MKNLLERALNIMEQHYGEDHVEVAITLYNLARAHAALGDRGNEAQILTKVLPIFERHFGVHHKHCVSVRRALIDVTRVTEADQQNPESCTEADQQNPESCTEADQQNAEPCVCC